MSITNDQLIDLFVSDAMIANGADVKIMTANKRVVRAVPGKKSYKASRWTEEEDRFVRENIGYLPVEALAAALGRSMHGIHVHVVRHGIPTMSRQPGWMTSNQIARMISIDDHKLVGWIDRGLLPGRYLPTERKICVVNFEDLKRWLCKPENWPYFDSNKIKNEYLKRLVNKAKLRWGDEWLSTRQVADLHNCDVKLVLNGVKRGTLEGIHCMDIGGRGDGNWAFWFIRKSSALSWRKPSHFDPKYPWTDRSDQALLRLRAENHIFSEIARMMKWPEKRVMYRFYKLQKEAVH